MTTDNLVENTTTLDGEALDAMIEPDRQRGKGYSRLEEYGSPIWAIVQRLGEPTPENVTRVAQEYHLPEVAVQAAIRFYQRNNASIDAVIQLNDDWFETLGS
jgi:hypothetical protein